MTSFSPGDAEPSTSRAQEDYRQQAQLVEHIRGLLARADARRETEPENHRKWNRVLDNLEAALSEAKGRLQWCERCLESERAGLQASGAPTPASMLPMTGETVALDHPDNPDATIAAKLLLAEPLECVEGAPLEQVALAQTYLAWRQQEGTASGAERRLAGRIELAIQGRNGKSARPGVAKSVQERRQQKALRDVVAKVQWNRLDTLTLRDLELAAECLGVLSRRLDLDESERRLKAILARGLAEAERVLGTVCRRSDGVGV